MRHFLSFAPILDIGRTRWVTHLALAAFTVAGFYAAHLYVPYADVPYLLTISMAYVSLALVAFSLLIGPYKLLWQRGNPVNIDLRRDVGIWAAVTGCIHVFFGFQIHFNGQIWAYFLELTPRGYRLARTVFGFSNDVGLVATVILIALLLLSNDYSMRRLKGKRWKFWQRFNYLLVILVLIHTLGYQTVSRREQVFTLGTLVLTVIVLAVQAAGFYLYRSRHARLSRSPEGA
jgi:sulfoxide reductase heme-binding subunit YedZ